MIQKHITAYFSSFKADGTPWSEDAKQELILAQVRARLEEMTLDAAKQGVEVYRITIDIQGDPK